MAGSSGINPRVELAKSLDAVTRRVKTLKKELEKFIKYPQRSLRYTDVMFSWLSHSGTGVIGPYVQGPEDCWAHAFSTCHSYHNSIHKLGKSILTPKMVKEGVRRRYLAEGGGLLRLDDAKEFMEGEGHVKKMVVYKRNEVADMDQLVEGLLGKGPVIVSISCIDSFDEYCYRDNGNGIYNPSDDDVRRLANEDFNDHVVVVTGLGAKLYLGHQEIREFFVYQDTKGANWGDNGFGSMMRGRGIINQVVDLQF